MQNLTAPLSPINPRGAASASGGRNLESSQVFGRNIHVKPWKSQQEKPLTLEINTR